MCVTMQASSALQPAAMSMREPSSGRNVFTVCSVPLKLTCHGQIPDSDAAGRRDDRIAAVKEWLWITDGPADAERSRLCEEYTAWAWRACYEEGPFDFGDEADFRRGIELLTELVMRRYSPGRPCTGVILRQEFGMPSLLYRLKARIDTRAIAKEEAKATGWDHSEFT
jgi:hypothetical protein